MSDRGPISVDVFQRLLKKEKNQDVCEEGTRLFVLTMWNTGKLSLVLWKLYATRDHLIHQAVHGRLIRWPRTRPLCLAV